YQAFRDGRRRVDGERRRLRELAKDRLERLEIARLEQKGHGAVLVEDADVESARRRYIDADEHLGLPRLHREDHRHVVRPGRRIPVAVVMLLEETELLDGAERKLVDVLELQPAGDQRVRDV